MEGMVEVVFLCDHCGTQNRLVAVGVGNNDFIRCSHCGTPIGKVDELSAKASETRKPAHRTAGTDATR